MRFSNKRVALVLVVLHGCVGTPIPIPIPIQTRALGLGAPTLGTVVVAGLEDAARGADEILVKNLTTGRNWSGPVSSTGSFAVVVEAQATHRLSLRTRFGAVFGDPVEVIVPSAALGTPKVGVVRSFNGTLSASGTVEPGAQVVLSLPRSGAAVSSAAVGGTFTFLVPVDARIGDTVYLFARSASGVSAHVTASVNPQTTGCIDDDLDGYGASATPLAQCTASTTVADCNDANNAVNPGQQQYFTAAIPGAPAGAAYDYNCDGTEEPQHAAQAACAGSQTCDAHGWQGAAPACGQSGVWIQCVLTKGCTEQAETRVQACR